ncbi:MAG: hypothetical protein V6Z81_01135 [Parvularculales bacterium]
MNSEPTRRGGHPRGYSIFLGISYYPYGVRAAELTVDHEVRYIERYVVDVMKIHVKEKQERKIILYEADKNHDVDIFSNHSLCFQQ